jgi:hypothetical protein
MHFSQLFIRVLFYLFFLAIADASYSQSHIRDIPVPSSDYKRIQIQEKSFAAMLRNLPLKSPGSDVLNYRGGIFKSGQDTSVAFVVDLDIQGRRLEQCMDILVRLYAEYLWRRNQVDHFKLPLPGGYWLSWKDWEAGFRPVFKGIDITMHKLSDFDDSYQSYLTYLNTVYAESHTQQFYHALQSLKREDVQIGDIIIRKGTKGHAIMIVDLAMSKSGEMIALIANGDTPACELFLLNHKRDKPWIPFNFKSELLDLPLKRTMGWDGLRRFQLPKED